MQVTIARLWKSDLAITGVVSVDGEQKYFELELPELFEGQPNVPDRCCIPAGTYNLTRYLSPKRGYFVPLVNDVPERSMIELHIGNYPQDTDGCILIGEKRINDAEIGESEIAFESFMGEFESALAAGETVTLMLS
jgi:hypothetical protein